MAGTMVPPASARPEVLPSERLQGNGRCVPALRARLRRIDDGRNALSVLSVWAAGAAIVAGAVLLDHPWAYVAAFVVMGPLYVRFAILMHEAAHRLLFSDRRVNDFVGTWLLAYPALVPFGLYRRAHMAHHRQEFGPDEPDRAFYSGYPCPPRSLARRLLRDAVGVSGYKNLRPLLRSVRSPASRRVGLCIMGVQLLLWAGSWALTGRWWIYPLLWFAPWMTQWRVLNRLRALGEHGGMVAGSDRRVCTHNVRQHWLARCWLVPYHTGWHLAHHVDMGIPWRQLPAFHEELVRAGYVTPALTYPSYLALWRAMISDGPGASRPA